MEDKTKVSLLYTLIGGLLGVLSAFLRIIGIPNEIILAIYIAVIYATTYLYFVVGVKFERLGESRPRAALGGVWPSIMSWLVIWTMVFYLISPAIILAGPSHNDAAESLQEYLEANGFRVKISDDYDRHLFAHKVVVLGSRVSIPLGTNYGITAFPDALHNLLSIEQEKGTVTREEVDLGQLFVIRKTGRLIIIISGNTDNIDEITQENQEKILTLLQ